MPGALQVRLDANNPGSVPVYVSPLPNGALLVEVTTSNPSAVPVRVSNRAGSVPVKVVSGNLGS